MPISKACFFCLAAGSVALQTDITGEKMLKLWTVYLTLLFLTACSSPMKKSFSDAVTRSPSSSWQPNGRMNQSFPEIKSPLFSSSAPLHFIIKSEFDRVHKMNEGGNWTGEDREDPKFWADAFLVESNQQNRILKGKLRSRGMSSATEGESQFPKLRVEINDDEDLKETVFKGSRNFRMNTHVNTNPTTEHTPRGRLNNEKSPFREATAYAIAQVLNLPSPLVRRARVTYTDLQLQQTFERNALIIETDKKIAERFGATVNLDFPSDDSNFKMNLRLAARFHAFNILIGNQDIGLKLKNESTFSTERYRPLFNTTIFQTPAGDLFPIVYDLDLGSIITGWTPWNYSFYIYPHFQISDGRIGKTVLRLSELRSRLNKAEYQQAVKDVVESENQILAVIENAIVDDDFKALARSHVHFFKQSAQILENYPILMKNDVRFFKDREMTIDLLQQDPIQETPGTLRPGTPVRVLNDFGPVVQIAILDFKADLLKPDQYVGFISKEDFILGDDLPENLQGHIDGRDM